MQDSEQAAKQPIAARDDHLLQQSSRAPAILHPSLGRRRQSAASTRLDRALSLLPYKMQGMLKMRILVAVSMSVLLLACVLMHGMPGISSKHQAACHVAA